METRSLDDLERQALSRLISGAEDRRQKEPLLAAGLTFMGVSAVGLLAWPWDRGLPSLVPIAIALAVAGVVFRRMHKFQSRSEPTGMLLKELHDDQAQITTYEAVDAIRVREREDEGSQYFLKLRDGQVLFLAGQYLYELEDGARFPNTKFQVVRTPRTSRLLAFNCLGDYLPPTSERRPFEPADYEGNRVPADGALLDLEWASLTDP